MDGKKEVTAADLKRGASAKDVKNGSGFGHMQLTLIFRPVSAHRHRDREIEREGAGREDKTGREDWVSSGTLKLRLVL